MKAPVSASCDRREEAMHRIVKCVKVLTKAAILWTKVHIEINGEYRR